MIHHDGGGITFEVGDYVGDITTGEERFGEIIEVIDSEKVLVSPDGKAESAWIVLESACYPG